MLAVNVSIPDPMLHPHDSCNYVAQHTAPVGVLVCLFCPDRPW